MIKLNRFLSILIVLSLVIGIVPAMAEIGVTSSNVDKNWFDYPKGEPGEGYTYYSQGELGWGGIKYDCHRATCTSVTPLADVMHSLNYDVTITSDGNGADYSSSTGLLLLAPRKGSLRHNVIVGNSASDSVRFWNASGPVLNAGNTYHIKHLFNMTADSTGTETVTISGGDLSSPYSVSYNISVAYTEAQGFDIAILNALGDTIMVVPESIVIKGEGAELTGLEAEYIYGDDIEFDFFVSSDIKSALIMVDDDTKLVVDSSNTTVTNRNTYSVRIDGGDVPEGSHEIKVVITYPDDTQTELSENIEVLERQVTVSPIDNTVNNIFFDDFSDGAANKGLMANFASTYLTTATLSSSMDNGNPCAGITAVSNTLGTKDYASIRYNPRFSPQKGDSEYSLSYDFKLSDYNSSANGTIMTLTLTTTSDTGGDWWIYSEIPVIQSGSSSDTAKLGSAIADSEELSLDKWYRFNHYFSISALKEFVTVTDSDTGKIVASASRTIDSRLVGIRLLSFDFRTDATALLDNVSINDEHIIFDSVKPAYTASEDVQLELKLPEGFTSATLKTDSDLLAKFDNMDTNSYIVDILAGKLPEGDNKITLELDYNGSKITSDMNLIISDETIPTSPVPDALVTDSSIDISASALEGTSITAFIDGVYAAKLSNSGDATSYTANYELPDTLSLGNHTLTLVSESADATIATSDSVFTIGDGINTPIGDISYTDNSSQQSFKGTIPVSADKISITVPSGLDTKNIADNVSLRYKSGAEINLSDISYDSDNNILTLDLPAGLRDGRDMLLTLSPDMKYKDGTTFGRCAEVDITISESKISTANITLKADGNNMISSSQLKKNSDIVASFDCENISSDNQAITYLLTVRLDGRLIAMDALTLNLTPGQSVSESLEINNISASGDYEICLMAIDSFKSNKAAREYIKFDSNGVK